MQQTSAKNSVNFSPTNTLEEHNWLFLSYPKVNSGYRSRHLYGNIWVPSPLSSLVWLTGASAFRQTGSQTKLFLRMGHYPRAALGFSENVIRVSLPLGNLQEFIFSAASLENDILTLFTWKSLCFLICNSGLSADRTPLRAGLWMDIKHYEGEGRVWERQRKWEQRNGFRGGFPGIKTRSEI